MPLARTSNVWVPSATPAGTARALARSVALGRVVAKTRDTAPQQELDNSAQQFANVDGAWHLRLELC